MISSRKNFKGIRPGGKRVHPFPEVERRSGGQEKHKNEEFQNFTYYDEMKPLLYTLRILARLPYQVTPEGKLSMRICSLWTISTGVMYILQTGLAVENTVGIVKSLRDSKGNVVSVLLGVNSLLFMGFHFYIPAAFWKEWPQIVRYFNQWRTFEKQFQSEFGRALVGSMKTWVLVAMSVCIFMVSLGTVMVSAVVYTYNWFNMIPYCIIFLYCNMYLLLWLFTCVEMGRVSTQIKRQILRVIGERKGGDRAEGLCRARWVWLSLSDLVQGLGDTFACSIIIMILVYSVNFVSCCYALLSQDILVRSTLFTFLFIVFSTGIVTFVLLEYSHRATQMVGPEFSSALLKLDTGILDDKSAHELNLILQATVINPPVIKLAGFVTVNRSMCVSLLSNTVTYLIVLVQLKSPTASSV